MTVISEAGRWLQEAVVGVGESGESLNRCSGDVLEQLRGVVGDFGEGMWEFMPDDCPVGW
jgi:hypothetical protein